MKHFEVIYTVTGAPIHAHGWSNHAAGIILCSDPSLYDVDKAKEEGVAPMFWNRLFLQGFMQMTIETIRKIDAAHLQNKLPDSLKAKCHVITLSARFPTYHPKAGQLTCFKSKVFCGVKKHTIRAIGKWPQRIEQINQGEAYLSVRQWLGRPYKDPQIEVCRMVRVNHDRIIVNKDFFNHKGVLLTTPIGKNGEERVSWLKAEEVAMNDGLHLKDFKEWFFARPDKEPEKIMIYLTNQPVY